MFEKFPIIHKIFDFLEFFFEEIDVCLILCNIIIFEFNRLLLLSHFK